MVAGTPTINVADLSRDESYGALHPLTRGRVSRRPRSLPDNLGRPFRLALCERYHLPDDHVRIDSAQTKC